MSIPSPNMGLPVPVVSATPGPEWAQNVNACLSAIDEHDHSPGRGVKVTPAGLDINADLDMSNNNLASSRALQFTSQLVPLPASGADLGALYVSGVDLYYNDGSGNQIRVTQGGGVTGAAGTITGLPSGSASASYFGGTFTFQSATLTPANFSVGPLTIGRNVASSKTVTLVPNAAQAADYTMTFPVALPTSLNYMTLDATGAISFNSAGFTGTGAVVLASGATITTASLSSPAITAATSITVGSNAFTGRLNEGIIVNTSASYGGEALATWSTNGTQSSILDFFKSASNTVGTRAAVAPGDMLGSIIANGASGAVNFESAAFIEFLVGAGAVSATSMPGRIVMRTTPTGTLTPLARLDISAAGLVTIGTLGGTQTHVVNGDLQVTGAISGSGAAITALAIGNIAGLGSGVAGFLTSAYTSTGTGAVVYATSPTISGATLPNVVGIGLADGTVSAPTLSFTGASSNTGMYLFGTDSIGFSANGINSGSIGSGGIWNFPFGLTLPSTGATPSTLDFYASTTTASVTFTWNSSAATMAGVLKITRIGNIVTLWLPQLTAATNGTDVSASTPAAALPSWARVTFGIGKVIITASGAGTGIAAEIQLFVDGSLTLRRITGAAWGAGTSGLLLQNFITYAI